MALLMDAPLHSGSRSRSQRRVKKYSLKTDMTPMVDLGFLLIAFFVVTAELTKLKVEDLNMPHDGTGSEIGMSNALTVLLGDENTVYYYHGTWKQAVAEGKIFKTSFDLKSGLGKVIRDRQQILDKKIESREGRDGLMILIKATDASRYDNVISLLDEILINDVKKYALVKAEPEEIAYIDLQKQ